MAGGHPTAKQTVHPSKTHLFLCEIRLILQSHRADKGRADFQQIFHQRPHWIMALSVEGLAERGSAGAAGDGAAASNTSLL